LGKILNIKNNDLIKLALFGMLAYIRGCEKIKIGKTITYDASSIFIFKQ